MAREFSSRPRPFKLGLSRGGILLVAVAVFALGAASFAEAQPLTRHAGGRLKTNWGNFGVCGSAAACAVNMAAAETCTGNCRAITVDGVMARDFLSLGGNDKADYTKGSTISGNVDLSSGAPPANDALASANCNPGCPIAGRCGSGEGRCGPKATGFYSFHHDAGDDMTYLFMRMRVNGNPTASSGDRVRSNSFNSISYNFLVSVDRDVFKEFWIEVQGGFSAGTDGLIVYYWNGNSTGAENTSTTNQVDNVCAVPGRSNSNCSENPAAPHRNIINRFLACTDDSETNGITSTDCATNSLARTFWINDPAYPDDWYIDIQIPLAALTTYAGDNPGSGNIGFPGSINQTTGARTSPFYTWDPNRRTPANYLATSEAYEFYPLHQITFPGNISTPPWGGNGPAVYRPNTTLGGGSNVPISGPTYLGFNYATANSGTDPLQKDYLLFGTSDTTPVTLSRFKTTPSGSGYRIEWTTVNEAANAGFDLFANGPNGWVKVNDRLIPARGSDQLSPQDYSFEAAIPFASEFRLVDVDIEEQEQTHGPFEAGQELGGSRRSDPVDWQGIASENRGKAQARYAAAREKASEKSRVAKAAAAKGTPPGLAGYPELRLRVSEDGLYRVTYEQLAAAGVDLAGVSRSLISLEARSGSVPVRVEGGKGGSFGPGSFVEFFGEAVKSPYTRTNVYRLAVNPRVGENVKEDPAAAGKAAPAAYYMETSEVHRNRMWNVVSPLADPWIDERIVASGPTSRSYTVDLDNLVGADTGASVTVGLWAETQRNHVQVSVNGTQVADSSFGGLVDATITAPVSSSLLTSGPNTITLRLPFDRNARFEINAVDRYSITYPRAFVARNGRLTFTASGNAFKVTGLPTSSVVVYRITEKKTELLSGASVSSSGAGYDVTFRGSADSARYVVSTVAALLSPELTPVPETTDPTVGAAQYVVITHPDFIGGLEPPLEPLVAAKQAQGLTVKVVDVNDVYEKFSFGVFDPQAIKAFVAQAAGAGTEYVLLVGGDTFDYLNYTGAGSISFVPTFYARTSPMIGFAPADGLFADLDGDKIADLAIGRLPVRSRADLDAAVAKTLAYAPRSLSAVFAADATTLGNNYAQICESAAQELGPGWNVTRAYVDALGVAGAKNAIVTGINGGAALTTYVGHSDVTYWSFNQLFTAADVATLSNAGAPTVVAQWGCWNTFFAHPTIVSLADRFLVTPGRGAAAVIGPSALSSAESDLVMSKALNAEFAKGGTLGKALTAAKAQVNATRSHSLDVLYATNLMGDPALLLP